MSDPTELAEELKDSLGDESDATVEELEEALTNLLDYNVPEQEAMDSLRRKYGTDLSNNGNNNNSDGESDPETNLEDINADEEWITVTGKVVELWDSDSDAIDQVGLIGDETDTMKFVSFESSNIETDLEEGETYRLSPVVTDEYEGRFSIKLNKQTDIEKLDEDLEVDDGSKDLVIPIVDIQQGSGLIKRCPDCGRPLRNGRCAEHGEVDGEFDLRIKAIGDTGSETVDILFDREATEELTGMTLEEAKQKATDAMNTEVVAEEIAEDIVGKYYHITGDMPFEYLLVDSCERISGDVQADARDILKQMEA